MKSLLTASPLGQRFNLILVAAALALAIPLLGLASPAGAAAKPDGPISTKSAACGRSAPNKEQLRVTDAAIHGPANIRSGSSAGCGALGVLMPTHDAIYFCFTTGTGGTWTYLRDLQTGRQGWVLDRLLRGNGSHIRCGF